MAEMLDCLAEKKLLLQDSSRVVVNRGVVDRKVAMSLDLPVVVVAGKHLLLDMPEFVVVME